MDPCPLESGRQKVNHYFPRSSRRAASWMWIESLLPLPGSDVLPQVCVAVWEHGVFVKKLPDKSPKAHLKWLRTAIKGDSHTARIPCRWQGLGWHFSFIFTMKVWTFWDPICVRGPPNKSLTFCRALPGHEVRQVHQVWKTLRARAPFSTFLCN